MQQIYVAIPATTVASDGTATIRLDNGWPLTGWSKWNVTITGAQGVATVLAGSSPIFGPVPITNGGVIGGPVLSSGGDQIIVRIVGGLPGDSIGGYIRGGNDPDPNNLDAIGAITSSTVGSTQSDPSRLLAGQIGNPLIDNVTQLVPATTGHVIFPGAGQSFDVGGYAAIVLSGFWTGAGAGVWGECEWLDAAGNTINVVPLNDLRTSFTLVLGVQGVGLRFHLFNVGVANTVQQLTLFPMVTFPTQPGAFLDVPGLGVGTLSLDARMLLDQGPVSIPASSSQTFDAGSVFSGEAIWTVGNDAGITANTWWSRLQAVRADGVVFTLARAGNVAMQQSQTVILPAMHIQVQLTNTGAGALNMYSTLMAL